MKNTLLVIVALLVGGCASTEAYRKAPRLTKPVKELTLREKVIGEYEIKKDEDTVRFVILENGNFEGYKNGKKEAEGKWKLSKEGELNLTYSNEHSVVFRINKDGSITAIIGISENGELGRERIELNKKEQQTAKKIK